MRRFAFLLALASATASAQTLTEPVVSGDPAESVVTLFAPEAVGLSAALGASGGAWAPPEAVVLEAIALEPGPHGRAAWRGFKTGAVVGGAISAVVFSVALGFDLNGACVDSFVCASHAAAIGSIPFTLATGTLGAGIGWVFSVTDPKHRSERP